MKKKTALTPDERDLFHQAIKGTTELQQDRVVHPPKRKVVNAFAGKKLLQAQTDAVFYFSDEFQPYLANDGPTRYLRPNASHYELKKLRRGDYSPDIFLDLHGLTQRQANQELSALIVACRHENLYCACVMHGYGKHILKQQTPLWLAQHPDVVAFHQAPREWGGDAALLVLIETHTQGEQK